MTVYTCQTPGYDAPRTDILNIPPVDIFKSNRLNAKMPKILPHLFLEDEITVWCDANIFLSADNLELIYDKLKQADVVALTHPNRNCIYEEAEVCMDAGLDDAEKIQEQVRAYKAGGFASPTGLFGCGMIARRYTLATTRFNEAWWADVTRWSSRDQISFPPAFGNIRIGTIPFKSVEIRPHLK